MMTAEAYWVYRAQLTPERAAALLGAPLADLSTPKAIGLRWASSPGLGVTGHAAKDVLLSYLKTADLDLDLDEAPVETSSDASDLDKVLRDAGVPSNVNWDVYSGSSNGRSSAYIWIVGRVNENTFCVLCVEYKGPGFNHYTRETQTEEKWEVNYKTAQMKGDPVKAVNTLIGSMPAEGRVERPKKWAVWPDMKVTDMSVRKMAKNRPNAALRDTLIGSGFLKEPENRKVIPNVELIFKLNPLKTKWDEALGVAPEEREGTGGRRYPGRHISQDVYLRVSGKEYQLEPETIASKKFQTLYSTFGLWRASDIQVNLAKSRKYPPAFTLGLLLDSLTGEPSGCIIGVTKALEWFESRDAKTASTPTFKRAIAWVTADEFATEMEIPLSDVLSYEAPHV